MLIEGRQCSSGQRDCHSPADSLSTHCGPQEDLFIDDEDLLEELAPLKDALERAVHRKNQVEQLKDQLEEEVRAFQTARACACYFYESCNCPSAHLRGR